MICKQPFISHLKLLLFVFAGLQLFNNPLLFSESSSSSTIIPNQAQIPLLSGSFSERQILKLRLKNGLEAYIVSDPRLEKSGALMAVKAGSWADPNEHPGVAHFLEHMLFLGTKKYPNESEFSQFVSHHGGTFNAFTSDIYTSYLFSIDNAEFESALDRLSHFFKEPLFLPSGVAREVQAIDQEFAKNIESDNIRMLFIWKELSNPQHPFHRFDIGNKETLRKVSQETLKQWYYTHYSADLMHLIVYSTLPLDKLQSLVEEEFQDIPTISHPHTDAILTSPLFPEELHGKIVYIEPIKHNHSLTVFWELPKKFADMKDSRPDDVASFLLGHEGKESLLAALKEEGLADRLGSGSTTLGLESPLFFVEIELSEAGINQVNTVLERLFQALASFRSKGVSPELFNEIQTMSKIHYQHQLPKDTFSQLMKDASHIMSEKLETFPEESSMIHTYNPKGIQELLDYLTPQNAFVFLMSPASTTGMSYDKHEQWLGTAYSIRPIAPEILKSWNQVMPEGRVTLPAKNPFIPNKLQLLNSENIEKDPTKAIPIPIALVNDEKGRIYFAQDRYYGSPKASLFFLIKTPEIEQGNAPKVVLTDLYVKCLQESLSSFGYQATIAGLSYNIEREQFGLEIQIEGYNEHAETLLDEILHQMSTLQPTEAQFQRHLAALTRDYQNGLKDTPISQASELLKSVLYQKFTTNRQKALAIKKISYESLIAYIQKVFHQTFIEGILCGNLTKEQGQSIAQKMLNGIGGTPYPLKRQKMEKLIALPINQGPFYYEDSIKMQGNAALLTIESEAPNFRNRAALRILMTGIKEAFFTTLRTNQQTGYITFSTFKEFKKQFFGMFAVQSNTHEGRDLLARFELFLEGFLQEIQLVGIPESRFEIIRNALITQLQVPPENLNALAQLLRKFAFEYEDFEWNHKHMQGLQEVSYQEFLDTVKQFIGRQNKQRLAILLYGQLPREQMFQYKPINNLNQLRKISIYND